MRITRALIAQQAIDPDQDLEGCGVYYIQNTLSGKCYIGSSIQFRARIRTHLKELTNGTHHCSHLQRSFNKHGISMFKWGVCEYVDNKNDLITVEQEWIDNLAHYNTSPTAGSPLGVKMNLTPEERERRATRARNMRSSLTEQELREMHRLIGEKRRGSSLSEDHKRKLSDAGRGRPCAEKDLRNLQLAIDWHAGLTEEGKLQRSEKIRSALNTRTPEQIAEWKRKLSESRKGKPSAMKGRTLSDEARRKISEARKGKPLSDEHKAKIKAGYRNLSDEKKLEISAKLSAAHKGRAKSPEHLAAIAIAKSRETNDT